MWIFLVCSLTVFYCFMLLYLFSVFPVLLFRPCVVYFLENPFIFYSSILSTITVFNMSSTGILYIFFLFSMLIILLLFTAGPFLFLIISHLFRYVFTYHVIHLSAEERTYHMICSSFQETYHINLFFTITWSALSLLLTHHLKTTLVLTSLPCVILPSFWSALVLLSPPPMVFSHVTYYNYYMINSFC